MQLPLSPGSTTLRRAFLLTASLTIGIVIWFLLGDTDGLVAEAKASSQLPATAESAGDEVLAHVDGVAITEAQIEAEVAAQLEALERRRQQLLDEALASRIDAQLIDGEAESRGLGRAELLRLEVDAQLHTVAPEDVLARYRAGGFAEPLAAVEERLRRELRREAFVEELRHRAAVAVYVEPQDVEPQDAEPQDVEADGAGTAD